MIFISKWWRQTTGVKTEIMIVIGSLILGLVAWVLDAFVDYFFFEQGAFPQTVAVDAGEHEIYSRVLLSVFLVVFGVVTAHFFSKRRRVEEDLRKTREELEKRVEERTAELSDTNKLLRQEILERERIEAQLRESEKRLRYLSSRLLTAQEQERRRVALELHDELGQALTVLKLQLRSHEKRLREDQSALKEDCEETIAFVDQIIKDVRRLYHDLSPSVLEELGLSAALRSLVTEFSKHSDIEISLDIEKVDSLFSPKAQIVIYRILQEALTNIGKHAQARHASVSINKERKLRHPCGQR